MNDEVMEMSNDDNQHNVFLDIEDSPLGKFLKWSTIGSQMPDAEKLKPYSGNDSFTKRDYFAGIVLNAIINKKECLSDITTKDLKSSILVLDSFLELLNQVNNGDSIMDKSSD